MRVVALIDFILISLVGNFNALPISNEIEDNLDFDITGIKKLENWGYLQKSQNRKLSSIQSNDEVSKAIKRFQKFFNLPESGVIDKQTKELMETPRCGVPDLFKPAEKSRRKRRFKAQGSAWRNRNVTWQLENTNDDGITPIVIREFMRRSLQKWSDNANINFVETPNAPIGSSQIRVRFEVGDHGDGFPFDGPSGTLAHAFFPLSNLGLSGDIHFDDAEKYTTADLPRSSGTIKLLWVAVHELGHSLGLSHSELRGAIMYPFYLHFPGLDFNLTTDDVLGIQSIYGARPTTAPVTTLSTQRPITLPQTSTARPQTNASPATESTIPPVGCVSKIQGVILGGDMSTIMFAEGNIYKSDSVGKIDLGPIKNTRIFQGLDKVDAAHRKLGNLNDIVFFHGERFSVYRSQRLLGATRLITDGYQGLPEDFRDVDAVLAVREVNKLYIFKGEDYWRFSELPSLDYSVDFDYPKKIRNHWIGVPDNIDAAFTWRNNQIYFFKGEDYYRLDLNTSSVRSGYPRKNSVGFLQCPTSQQQQLSVENLKVDVNSSSSINNPLSPVTFLFILIGYILLSQL